MTNLDKHVAGPKSLKRKRKAYFTPTKYRSKNRVKKEEGSSSLQAAEAPQYAKRGGPYGNPVKRVLQAQPFPEDYVPPPPEYNKPPSRFFPTKLMDMEGLPFIDEYTFESVGDAPGPVEDKVSAPGPVEDKSPAPGPVEDKRIRKPRQVFDPSDPATGSQCVDPPGPVIKQPRKRTKKPIPDVAPPASPLPDTMPMFVDILPPLVGYPYDGPVPPLVGMTDDEFQDHIDNSAFKQGEDLGSPKVTGKRKRSPDPTEDLD
jgi:hypothetical protein